MIVIEARLLLRRAFFLRRQCGEMFGTATLNFLRMLYIFAGKGFCVIIHGLQRWLQYGIDERNDQAVTNNRGLFSKYVQIWKCDRSLLYCCKFTSCLGSSHWWGFVISVNVLRFVLWGITFPKKFILNSIYALRHLGSFYIFLKSVNDLLSAILQRT